MTQLRYLLATFAEAAGLPGLAGLFDPAHNPLFRLPLSGDGARELIGFFRTVVPETGVLVHDFADAAWSTRFLGDLYQDLRRTPASGLPCCRRRISSRRGFSTGRWNRRSGNSGMAPCG